MVRRFFRSCLVGLLVSLLVCTPALAASTTDSQIMLMSADDDAGIMPMSFENNDYRFQLGFGLYNPSDFSTDSHYSDFFAKPNQGVTTNWFGKGSNISCTFDSNYEEFFFDFGFLVNTTEYLFKAGKTYDIRLGGFWLPCYYSSEYTDYKYILADNIKKVEVRYQKMNSDYSFSDIVQSVNFSTYRVPGTSASFIVGFKFTPQNDYTGLTVRLYVDRSFFSDNGFDTFYPTIRMSPYSFQTEISGSATSDDVLNDGFNAMNQAIQDTTNAVNKVNQGIQSMIGQIKDMSAGLAQMSQAISQMTSQLTQALDQQTQSINAMLNAQTEALRRALGLLDDSVSSGFSSLNVSINQQTQQVTTKIDSLQQTVTNKLDTVNQSIGDLTDKTQKGFTDVKKGITELPGKIGEMLKGLIVPDSDKVSDKFTDFKDLAESKLGVVYQVPEMMFDMANSIVSGAAEQKGEMTLPAFAIIMPDGQNLTVWEEYTFQIWPAGTEIIHTAVQTATSMICVIFMFNALKRKYEDWLDGK